MARLSAQGGELLRAEKEDVSAEEINGITYRKRVRKLKTLHTNGSILEKLVVDSHDYGWKKGGKVKAGLSPTDVRAIWERAGYTVTGLGSHNASVLRSEAKAKKEAAAKVKRAEKAKAGAAARAGSLERRERASRTGSDTPEGHIHGVGCLSRDGQKLICGRSSTPVPEKATPKPCADGKKLLAQIDAERRGQITMFPGANLQEAFYQHASTCHGGCDDWLSTHKVG